MVYICYQRLWDGLCPILFSALLVSCVALPKQETKLFSNNVSEIEKGVDPLLFELSAAERSEAIIELKSEAAVDPSQLSNFDPSEAYYFASIGDGPNTTKLRSAFGVIESYAALLTALVDGSSVAEWQGQVQTIASNISVLAPSPQFSAVVKQLDPIIGQLLTAHSNAEARKLVLAGRKPMLILLGELRNSSDQIFQTLVFQDQPGVSARSKTERKTDMDAARTKVANYVVLLDRLATNFVQMADAYSRPSNAVTLSVVAEASGNLAADAKAARAVFATLNR
ncbi:hypothetical protein X739_32540 [Mesorhizobium sp. LNHC220B00]|nr:hypothetical protein [Mesorhizobium sp. LNHC220B00]ESY77852.1 hypothetical protein X739_32540 [Mesorhizobium sp. LNHC220B00]